MTARWDELWPTAEPPEDFALRVVVESVEHRATAKSRWRWLLAAVVPGLCLVLAIGLSFKQHQEEATKRAAILEAQRKDTEERLHLLQLEFDTAQRREQDLQAHLADAREEVERAKLQAELEQQRAQTHSAQRALRSGSSSGTRAWAPAAKKKSSSACSPADPLCNP